MSSVAETLKRGESVLAEGGVADPRREAVSLLTIATGRDRTFLYAHPELELSADQDQMFDAFLKRRSGREPFQYISGIQEFFGLDFEVTPDVLIPRPETEILVERAIEIIHRSPDATFCEVGVGSGCISVSVLSQSPRARAIGLDVSTSALQIARRNAERHKVGERLDLRESNVYRSLSGEKFDLILSNPPYIPDADINGLQPEVRDFEPHLALDGGVDGLDIIRRLVTQAPDYLLSGGFLLMEIGIGQAEAVPAMFDRERWSAPDLLPDLQGIPRLVCVRLS